MPENLQKMGINCNRKSTFTVFEENFRGKLFNNRITSTQGIWKKPYP